MDSRIIKKDRVWNMFISLASYQTQIKINRDIDS